MKNSITILLAVFFLFVIEKNYAQTVYTIGNGTMVNSSTDYPTPYGNYYFGSKEQYLIRGQELINAGATAGNITKLEFNVANAVYINLNGFSIKMGSTSDTALSSYFYNNLNQVYSIGSYQDQPGWNAHEFQAPFYWDGYSNIIIDVCFNNTNYIDNAGVYSSSTSFASTLNYHDDDYGVCGQNEGDTYFQRPNMRFTIAPPPQNDLGVLSILSPIPNQANTPSANQPISISVKNFGISAQDSFILSYSVDFGNSWVQETYNGALNAGDTMTYTFTTLANMSNNSYYQVMAKVNNAGDQNPNNNEIQNYVIMCNPLSGNYTLGNGQGYDFQSFPHFASMLNSCGVAGPVNVSVAAGVYENQVYFSHVNGISATNKVTISSASGIATDVVLQYNSTDYNNNFTVMFNNASNIEIKDITIKALHQNYNTVVKLDNNCHNIVLKGNKIVSATDGYNPAIHFNIGNDNQIVENEIIGGGFGIRSEGYDTYSASQHILIAGNDIKNFREGGIYATYNNQLKISNNLIEGIVDYSGNGIALNRCSDSVVVSSNQIIIESRYGGQVNGLLIQYFNNGSLADTTLRQSYIINNMVSAISQMGYCNALYSYFNEKVSFYNNSLYADGSNNSNALYQSNGTSYLVGENYINNVFYLKSEGYAAYIASPNAISQSNYNNYYAPNSSSFVYAAGDRSSLVALQTATNRDINSVSINPMYLGYNNLHSASIAMSNKGIYLAEVPMDIDGETRSTSTPDMGADEYTPPQNNLTITELTSSTIVDESMCNLGNENLIITVVNNGAATQTSIPFSFKINNQNTVTETWSGSLPSGDTLVYTFTTLGNFSQAGNIILMAYVGLANDENKLDDTIKFVFNTYTSINTFPFLYDFEDRNNKYFHVEKNQDAFITIDTIHGFNSESALYMMGQSSYNGWNYYGSDLLQNLNSNSSHYVEAALCPIDASQLTALRMTFRIEQNNSNNPDNSFFFVKINDSLFAKTLEGDSVFNEIETTFKTFDLTPFVGGNIDIKLCAILRTNEEYNYGGVDDVTIDDFSIYVPQPNDVAVVDVGSATQNQCGSETDTVYLIIKNLGLNPQHNIPVVLNMSWGPYQYHFTATYTDTLLPNQEGIIVMGEFNSKINGYLDFKAYTNLATDQQKGNDTLIIKGQMDNHLEIPYVENWEDEDSYRHNWNFNNGFYVMDFYHLGIGHVLTMEAWGQGELAGNEGMETPEQENYDLSSATLRTPIGMINSNSYLIFDYRFFQLNNMDDSINVAVQSDCDGPYQTIFSINKYQTLIPNMWHKAAIPLASYAGKMVNLQFYKVEKQYSNSNFVLGFDNVGIVNATPVNLGTDTSLCFGDTLMLNSGLQSGNGYKFRWTGPGVTQSDTLPYLYATNSGSYLIELIDKYGLSTFDTIHITIRPQVSANLSTQKSVICQGDSSQVFVNILGQFPVIFNWTDGNTIQSDTAFSFISSRYLSPNATTQYSLVSLMDIYGCEYSSTENITIQVNQLISVNVSGLDSQYCTSASPDNLVGVPSGGVFSGNGIVGNSFNPYLAGPGGHVVYYYFTDSNGCNYEETMTTQVNSNPIIGIVSTIKSNYCENELPEILLGFPSGGAFSGDGMTGNLFTPANGNIGLNTIYYSFTDQNNCSSVDSVNFYINAVTPVQFTTSLNSSYCSNDAAINLTATPTGGTFTGQGVSGSVFNPANAGIGQVNIVYTYANANGCINSDTISTQINALPVVVFTSQNGAGYCQNGNAVTLGGYPTGGTFSGNGVSGNLFNPSLANIGTNDLVYIYQNAQGCSNSDTIEAIVYATPVVSLANEADICSTVSQLGLSSGSPAGGVYSGLAVNSSNGKFYPTIANIGENTFYYSYTDANGCTNKDTATIRVIGQPNASFTLPSTVCLNDSITVNYTGGASALAQFNWNFNNPQVQLGTGAGPYTLGWSNAGIKAISLVVTDSGCVSSTQFNYTNVLDAIANISAVNGVQACFGDSVLVFANSGLGYQYQWFDTSNSLVSNADTLPYFYSITTGSYYAKVINNYGCVAISDTLDLTIHPMINSDFNLPSTACKDDLVSIQFIGNQLANSTYTWNFNQGTIASGSAAGPYNIIWNTNGSKNVSLQVDNFGCSSEVTTKTINIVTTPATITPLGATTFCDGGSVTLYANSGANLTYEWFKNGISLNDFNSYYTATQAGSYSVKVTDAVLGCDNVSPAVQVTVNSTNFNLAFTANQTNFTIQPFIVNITNQTTDTSSYYWNWSFGDGGVSTVANPTHQYPYDGIYTVGVIAQNINTGCFDTLVKNNYISCTGGSSNPCTLVATITPTGPMNICPGDSVKLTAAFNANATYQWLKDGVIISGADTTFYWAKQLGNYQVMITNAICSKFSSPFSLSVYNTITPVIVSSGSIMPCTNDSMQLYVTSSFNSYLWSNGKNTPSIYIKNSGNYMVQGTDINGCKTSSQPFVVNASLLTTPQICIVGVDSATNSNFVVWERNANPLIDSFKVYRESSTAGVYTYLGSTSINDPGIFHDVNSNPRQQAYRYKITAVDSCGMETPPSDFHKTIHLSINAGLNNSWNLIWSHYVGFNFGSYRIYRGSDSTALQPLTQIQSNLNSFTDLNPPSGKVYYQIEVIAPHSCFPDSLYSKAQTNYNTSRSNNVNTSIAGGVGMNEMAITDFSVAILPNPNNGSFEIQLMSAKNDNYQISVVNMLGQEIYTTEVFRAYGQFNQSINLGKTAPGIYYLVVENQGQRLVKKLVVN